MKRYIIIASFFAIQMLLKTNFKLKFMQYPAIHTPIKVDQTTPLYNIIIIYDTILRQKRHFKHEK